MPFSPRYRHFPIPADVIAKRSPSPPALNFSPAIVHNGSADNADNGVPSMSGPTIIRDNAHAQAPHQKAQGQWPPAPRRQQRSPERYRLLCSRAVFLSHAIEAKLSLYLGMLLRETPRGRPTASPGAGLQIIIAPAPPNQTVSSGRTRPSSRVSCRDACMQGCMEEYCEMRSNNNNLVHIFQPTP